MAKKIILTKLSDSEKRRVAQLERGRLEPVKNVIPDGKENSWRGESICSLNLKPDYVTVDGEESWG